MTDRTPEEWGRAAMALRGWTGEPGMLWRVLRDDPLPDLCNRIVTQGRNGRRSEPYRNAWPDVDDDATAGWLLRAVWPHVRSMHRTPSGACSLIVQGAPGDGPIQVVEATVGRACVRAMELRAEVGCD